MPGEIAEAMLDGLLCQGCGEDLGYRGEALGFPKALRRVQPARRAQGQAGAHPSRGHAVTDFNSNWLCRACRYWAPGQRNLHDLRSEFEPAARESVFRGECRRHAPTLVPEDREVVAGWPETEPREWCGEFLSLEPRVL